MDNTHPRRPAHKLTAVLAASLIFGLTLICGVSSWRWVHTVFPGFFIMANQVIASVSLPSWPIASQPQLYQQAVIAVNNQTINSSTDLYDAVRHAPPGSVFTYTSEKDGKRSQIALPSVIFTFRDYFLLFGAYLVSGLTLALIGVIVWWLKPEAPASRALCLIGLTGGVFALTGADLYGPHWFFRLHVLGEAFFPAGFVHLALVFPIDRIRRRRWVVLSLPYVVAGILGLLYELFLHQPGRYSFIHNLCTLYGGIGGVALFLSVVWAYVTTTSHLIRQKIRIVLIGFLAGFALPATLMLWSSFTGGEISVNYAGFTTMLFPLSLGYAVVKHDLFEIDALLRRSVYYLTLTGALMLAYLTLLTLLNLSLRFSEVADSPLFPLFFTLGVVLILNPLKEYVQEGVDRVFFRVRYNPKKILETTSATLASTLHLDEILAFIWRILQETMAVRGGGLLLLTSDARQYLQVYPPTETPIACPTDHPLLIAARQKKGRTFSLYDCIEMGLEPYIQARTVAETEWFAAQLFVPLLFKNDLIGLIILGKKESGTFFSADDIEFLTTLANQSALSIANALAYQQIREFNIALEKEVQDRTQALAHTNDELHQSLTQLEAAYRDLQRSQENLVRAEKMADLGRLTAGIAHEMNTPLGASLTSLKLLKNLVQEYRTSIGDDAVTEHDHQEIAAEMDQLIYSTQQWMEKAAAHIRSLKLHTRDAQRGEECFFSVLHVVEDARMLLAHHLRLSGCTITISCHDENPMIYGDPSKLGQVLTNLLGNAIDAYKNLNRVERNILVTIDNRAEGLEIRVKDEGCGIPPENLDRIFDDLFSTKPLGEGTGLGLPISRNIMSNFFGGDIHVESALGLGSTFILSFPRKRDAAALAAAPQLTKDSSTEVVL